MRTDGLEKEMMLACGEGRRLGRPRRRWTNEIHDATGMNLAELRDLSSNRKQWRVFIMTMARAQGVDSTR